MGGCVSKDALLRERLQRENLAGGKISVLPIILPPASLPQFII
jgi:hypothetical protein